MKKIGDVTSTANSAGEFTNGNPAQGIPATTIEGEWLNGVQRELVNAITGSGLTIDASNDRQLLEAITAISRSSSNIIGKIELMPFRTASLPEGWYHANGDKYAVDSVVGKALLSLPTEYKQDWGIVESAGMISLPNMYHSDGRAYFQRAGSTPAVVQNDAIRNITGTFNAMAPLSFGGAASGALSIKQNVLTNHNFREGNGNRADYTLDASLVVPTAEENRPLSISFVPAVYLGV